MPRAASGSASGGHPGPRRDPIPSILPAPSPGTTGATLLLNATYEPLCVVSSRRAIVLVLAAKAESVDSTQDVVHAETISLPVPVVARLTRYVRVPFPSSVPLSRRAVFTRDGQTCVYCGSSATSIDHVVPRSRGGTHTWDNVVAACRRCNHTKADRSLAEKAEPVDSAADVVHAARVSLPVPVVVRLTRFVRVPYPASVPLSRRAVFTRDGQTCVYCGGSATSIDHVVPRSRGGTHTWDNVVAACRRCNHTKADRSLAEMGWALPHPPRTPSGAAWRLLGTRTVDPRWRNWLGMPESVSA